MRHLLCARHPARGLTHQIASTLLTTPGHEIVPFEVVRTWRGEATCPRSPRLDPHLASQVKQSRAVLGKAGAGVQVWSGHSGFSGWGK